MDRKSVLGKSYQNRFIRSRLFQVYCCIMQSEHNLSDDRPKIPFRRVLVLLIPGFFSLAMVALILIWEAYNPPGWQRAMENHLAAYVAVPKEVLSAGRIRVAQQPFLLSPTSPFQPVSPSAHYQTEPLPADVRPDAVESLGKKPLPYPVLELYCIDLTQSGADLAVTRYLVTEHRDLHASDWIVYTPSQWATVQAVDAAWEELGCNEE